MTVLSGTFIYSEALSMNRLFAIDTFDEIVRVPKQGITHFDVTVHWFCRDRGVSAVEFTESELGWVNVTGYLSEYAYQFFTQNEADELEHFLKYTYGAAPKVTEVYLPLSEMDIPYSRIPPEPMAGPNYGFINLVETPAPSLKVSGYYDTEYTTVTPRYQLATVKSLVERAGFDRNIYRFDWAE